MSALLHQSPWFLFFIFYKYYNIFYRNCQYLAQVRRFKIVTKTNHVEVWAFCLLGWLDSNQRNAWFWTMILDYAPIKVLILSFKAMCLTPWLHPILYKYYIIFYNICQDFYWRKWEDSNLWTPFGVSPLARECFIATQPHFQLSINIISYFRIFVNL